MKSVSLFALLRTLLFALAIVIAISSSSPGQTSVDPPDQSSSRNVVQGPAALIPFGGISATDFQPLIELIQNTVHNESWLDTGQGLGTIQAYPSGVYVDPSGTLKKLKIQTDRQGNESLDGGFVLQPDREKIAGLRKVSLTRLQQAAQLRAAQGLPPTMAMQNLAGLTNIQYLVAVPESGELIIAGDGGSWRYDQLGRPFSITNGDPVLQLDDLVVCLRNAYANNSKFGCAITPRQKNLAATQQFIATSKLKGKAWSEKLRQTLGQQDIEVFGIDDRSHAARVLVEADWHMKRIGMGLDESIPGVPGFLERVELRADGSPPPMDLVRWWFTLNYEQVLTDADQQVYTFTGTGVKVLSENELLDQQGRRIHTGKTQGPAKDFAADFTQHFESLAQKYPIYRELKNLFDLALVATLIRSQELDQKTKTEWTLFGDETSATATPSERQTNAVYQIRKANVAKQVDSVMNERIIKVRRRNSTLIHTLVGVSGGVSCDFNQFVSPSLIESASNEFNNQQADEFLSPTAGTRWWWD